MMIPISIAFPTLLLFKFSPLMDVFRLSEWGPCRNLDFDPIGVFEKDGVVFLSACERMPFGIQQRDTANLQFPVQFVYLMLCVDSEGEMVQSRPAAVVGSILRSVPLSGRRRCKYHLPCS